MATTSTQAPAAAQLLVSISDLSMVNDIKKAISMLKGVTGKSWGQVHDSGQNQATCPHDS